MDDSYSILRDRFSKQIVQHSMRKTPERFAVLDALNEMGKMVGVQELLDYLTNRRFRISRSTLYNVLSLLCEWEYVVKVQVDPHNVLYGLAAIKGISLSLVCDKCGKLFDVEGEYLEEFRQKSLNEFGFVIDNQKVLVHGLCNKCKKH
ncbi:MAG: transcriptional repressor [Marinifilaceae bacterium]|nr:transcriptional repressor [Marinifilaceae bacterium]